LIDGGRMRGVYDKKGGKRECESWGRGRHGGERERESEAGGREEETTKVREKKKN